MAGYMEQDPPQDPPQDTVIAAFHAKVRASLPDALAFYLAHRACFPPRFVAYAFRDNFRLHGYFAFGERYNRVPAPSTDGEFDRFLFYVERAHQTALTLNVYDIVTGVMTLLIPWERFSEILQFTFLTCYLPTFSAAFQQEFYDRMRRLGLRNPAKPSPRWR